MKATIKIIDTVKVFKSNLFPDGYKYISGVSIVRETDKAILLESNGGATETVWIPKSTVISIEDTSYGAQRLAVKNWVAYKNDSFFRNSFKYA